MSGSTGGGDDGGIDFVVLDLAVGPDETDDVIDLGPRRPLPGQARYGRLTPTQRRLGWIAAVLVAALAAAGFLVAHQRSTAPIAAPSPSPSRSLPVVSPSVPPDPVPVGPFPSLAYTGPAGNVITGIGTALDVGTGAPLDLAISDSSLLVLLDSSLVVVNAYSRQILGRQPLVANAHSRLLFDVANSRLWVVDQNTLPARIQEFDSTSLRPLRSLEVQETVFDSAAIDGRLFLATDVAVKFLAPGASTLTAVKASNPPVSALTADLVRDTVVGLIAGPSGRLLTISSDGNTVLAGPQITVAGGSVAVVKDGLWVGGVGLDGHAALFDPDSMRMLSQGAGGALVLVAAGQAVVSAGANSLWVYSAPTKRLYCVDANSGQELQHWDGLAGPVTAGGSGPYSIAAGEVVPLVLRGYCRG
jgi:hypothetical protein